MGWLLVTWWADVKKGMKNINTRQINRTGHSLWSEARISMTHTSRHGALRLFLSKSVFIVIARPAAIRGGLRRSRVDTISSLKAQAVVKVNSIHKPNAAKTAAKSEHGLCTWMHRASYCRTQTYQATTTALAQRAVVQNVRKFQARTILKHQMQTMLMWLYPHHGGDA